MMRSPVPSNLNSSNQESGIRIITDRQMYQTGHILTQDLEKQLPAIHIEGWYYSFFRVEATERSAIQTVQKLHESGDASVITRIPKGYAIWILEREAQPFSPRIHPLQSGLEPVEPTESLDSIPSNLEEMQYTSYLDLQESHSPYQVLTSGTQYRNCYARVSGLDRPVQAIEVEGRYYSLFKTVVKIQESAQWVKRLASRGDYTVVTRMPQGYGVWVLEENAYPIELS